MRWENAPKVVCEQPPDHVEADESAGVANVSRIVHGRTALVPRDPTCPSSKMANNPTPTSQQQRCAFQVMAGHRCQCGRRASRKRKVREGG
jgi:hypothetical protein